MPRYALSMINCQFSRPCSSSAKFPLPPSCPVSVAPVANPCATGPRKLFVCPPKHPPPPVPRHRPLQVVIGSSSHTLTRAFAGGCVTIAVTRHEPSAGSIAADSIFVFGSVTFNNSSQPQVGIAAGKIGFGALSAAATVHNRLQQRIALK